jgi:hypothetical protein
MLTVTMLCAAALAGLVIYRRLWPGGLGAAPILAAPPPVRAAAKRLDIVAQPGTDPTDSLPCANICIAAMAVAFARMDDESFPCEGTIGTPLRRHLHTDAAQAHDIWTMPPWLVDEGGTPTQAFERLSKRLKRLDHGPYFGRMMGVLGDVTTAGTRGMPTAPQVDAMGALARIFRTA